METPNCIRLYVSCATLLAVLSYSTVSRADHPNAGTDSLSELLTEAYANSLQIKEAEKSLASISIRSKQALSPYLPEVSLEGGYQMNRLSDESTKGSFGYAQGKINLYRGGKDRARKEIKEREVELAEFKVRKLKSKVERTVSRQYYELLYLQESIALKTEAINSNKSQVEMAKKKKVAGFTSQADVLEFEFREATLKSDLNLLMQNESILELELRQILGRNSENKIRVSGHLKREIVKGSIDQFTAKAINENETLGELNSNLKTAGLEKDAIFSNYLPQLNLEGKYGRLATEERVLSGDNNYQLMLKLSVPLFSGLDTRYGSQAQTHEISKLEISKLRVEQEIRTEIQSALTKFQSINERLDLEEKNIERSKQYYEITQAEYRRGVKNSPDLAGAAERLFDARIRNLEYRKEVYFSILDLAETLGVTGGEIIGLR